MSEDDVRTCDGGISTGGARFTHSALLTHVRQIVHDAHMTQTHAEEFGIPPETLGWRLRRALDWAGVSAKEMADELDVSEGTISRWCHDVGAAPRSIYLRAWASKCKVPFGWLTGDENPSSHKTFVLCDDEPPAGPSQAEILALTKSSEELRKRIPLRATAPVSKNGGRS